MIKTHTVTLGGQPVKLVIPQSFATLNDIREASTEQRNRMRVAAAALGVCLETSGAVKLGTRYSRVDFHVLGYGGDVLDELVRRYGEDDVIPAAVSAWRLVLGLDPNLEPNEDEQPKTLEAEAEAREGFSAAPAEGPTS